MKLVLIIAASKSDVPIMEGAGKILQEFGVEHEMAMASVHRSPEKVVDLVKKAERNGVKVIICGAGLAAHLAGSIASRFPLPVIGVPLKSGPLEGLDALFATMQMPPGVPVATVAINGAKNAGILAVQILATSDKSLEEKLIDYKNKLAV